MFHRLLNFCAILKYFLEKNPLTFLNCSKQSIYFLFCYLNWSCFIIVIVFYFCHIFIDLLMRTRHFLTLLLLFLLYFFETFTRLVFTSDRSLALKAIVFFLGVENREWVIQIHRSSSFTKPKFENHFRFKYGPLNSVCCVFSVLGQMECMKKRMNEWMRRALMFIISAFFELTFCDADEYVRLRVERILMSSRKDHWAFFVNTFLGIS